MQSATQNVCQQKHEILTPTGGSYQQKVHMYVSVNDLAESPKVQDVCCVGRPACIAISTCTSLAGITQ